MSKSIFCIDFCLFFAYINYNKILQVNKYMKLGFTNCAIIVHISKFILLNLPNVNTDSKLSCHAHKQYYATIFIAC